MSTWSSSSAGHDIPAAMAEAAKPAERKKRTITEIRDSKQAGEKMVYTSVLDYTLAKWAETAGVEGCVVGDSLAMTCHGHPNPIPATMDMMVLHAAAVRRGAPNTFVLGCMPYQSYHTIERALANATRFMQEAACDAVKPQGGKSQAHVLKALVDAGIPTASHIGLTPHTIAMFGGFKIQGRTADAAMKILEDALAIEDAGCFMLELEPAAANIAERMSEQRAVPPMRLGPGARADRARPLCPRRLRVLSECALASSLAIGRTSIREALQRRAREGLVTILPRKGILVSETDPRKQLLVLEVRRELERLLARLGAQRANEEQRQRLREIADGMDRAAKTNDDIVFMRLDRELNLLISAAAHNDYATRAIRSLHGHSRRFWYLHYKQAADLPLCARLHASQARAISDGKPERAA